MAILCRCFSLSQALSSQVSHLIEFPAVFSRLVAVGVRGMTAVALLDGMRGSRLLLSYPTFGYR